MIFVSSYCSFCRTLSNQSIMSQQINGSDFQCRLQASGLEVPAISPQKKTERKGKPPFLALASGRFLRFLAISNREKMMIRLMIDSVGMSTFEERYVYRNPLLPEIYSPSLPKNGMFFQSNLPKKNDVEILWQSIKLHGTWFTAPVDSGINLLHCL